MYCILSGINITNIILKKIPTDTISDGLLILAVIAGIIFLSVYFVTFFLFRLLNLIWIIIFTRPIIRTTVNVFKLLLVFFTAVAWMVKDSSDILFTSMTTDKKLQIFMLMLILTCLTLSVEIIDQTTDIQILELQAYNLYFILLSYVFPVFGLFNAIPFLKIQKENLLPVYLSQLYKIHYSTLDMRTKYYLRKKAIFLFLKRDNQLHTEKEASI